MTPSTRPDDPGSAADPRAHACARPSCPLRAPEVPTLVSMGVEKISFPPPSQSDLVFYAIAAIAAAVARGRTPKLQPYQAAWWKSGMAGGKAGKS